MQAAPINPFELEPPSAMQLVLAGVFFGLVLYHLLRPERPVRVVRLAVMPGGAGPNIEAP
jgi:hypothetical protein